MKRFIYTGFLIFILNVGLNAQLPPLQDVRITNTTQNPAMNTPELRNDLLPVDNLFLDINDPECDYPRMECEALPPDCLGLFIPGHTANFSGDEHSFEFYIWSNDDVYIMIDGEVKEKDGDGEEAVYLDGIVWQYLKNGRYKNIPGYDPSFGDFYDYSLQLNNFNGSQYYTWIKVYPSQVIIRNNANGEYKFWARVTLHSPW